MELLQSRTKLFISNTTETGYIFDADKTKHKDDIWYTFANVIQSKY